MTIPVRVYLAARYGRRDEMQGTARWLRSLGYVVTSRWVECEDDDQMDSPEAARWAVNDVTDVLASDVLVLFGERAGVPGAGRGGRMVELGVALGAGKEIIIVGPVENVFGHHPRAIVAACKTDMARALRSLAEARSAATEQGRAA